VNFTFNDHAACRGAGTVYFVKINLNYKGRQ
jgi:hypothetical protein